MVPLRTPSPSFAGGPNVVPIRPGALRQFLSSEERPRSGGEDESVELTSHERDAFREIARALGAKIRDHRPDDPSPPTQRREHDGPLPQTPPPDAHPALPGQS